MKIPVINQLQHTLINYKPRLINRSSVKRAAVAIIFQTNDGEEPQLIFIKRSENPADPWSGHMAFPGGRVEKNDNDIIDAAYRETREEIGINLKSEGIYVTQIDDTRAMARGKRLSMIITPFVFLLPAIPVFSCNEEVVEIHRIPLSFFTQRNNKSTVSYTIKGITIPLPCYRYNDRIIWGLTYRMLQNLFRIIKLPRL